MADENDTAATPDPVTPELAPQAPATPAPQVITMTPEELEAKLNERAAQTRRALEAKSQKQPDPPKPKKGEEPQPQGLSPEEVQSMMRRQSAFDRAIGKASLDDDQVSILETLFNVEKPTDVADWVARKSKAFGSTANVQPKTPSAPATPASPSSPPPPAPPPAPNASIVTDRPVDVLQWDRDMMAKFYASKGGNPRDFSDPRNSKIWEEIANMTRSAAAQLRLLMEPRK